VFRRGVGRITLFQKDTDDPAFKAIEEQKAKLSDFLRPV